MKTKPIIKIKIDDSELESIANHKLLMIIEDQIKFIDSTLNDIVGEIDKFLKESNWIEMNSEVFYNHAVGGIFPDLKKFEIGKCDTYHNYDPRSFKKNFSGFTGTLMTQMEYNKAFNNQWEYLNKKYGWGILGRITVANSNLSVYEYSIAYNGYNDQKWNGSYSGYSYHIPIHRLAGVDGTKMTTAEVLLKWVIHDLMPIRISSAVKEKFKLIKDLYKTNNKLFIVEKNAVRCNKPDFVLSIKSEKIKSFNGTNFSFEDVVINLKNEMPIKINDSLIINKNIDKLLNCDKVRADIEAYDEKILTDPNRGHWDLWEIESPHFNGELYWEMSEPFMARNPISDIREDGVIGIDFGTKSTVVVFQENSEHTMPMRIGTGHLSKKIEPSHYENPTVMEIIDFEDFINRYESKIGRPDTLWEDLTTSHTAFGSFLNSSSKDYYSYLYELKQWAGDKNRQIRLRDKKNKDLILPPFLKIGEENFNPIEIYAYYIGLYINNMHNGIYLDYYLSYPVTFEKDVRDKIIASFEKGIKKTLPEPILKNSEIMNKFKVRIGASEPVAYAVCALEKYGFDPSDDEQVFYGVFDFGGGTTDFDFGLYREARQNERRWDYVIESFGAGGDQYLGGENILELLAFEVFKTNIDKLRSDGITFQLPPECKRFLGSEMLISASQEAKLNMAQLIEKLRAFWERHEGYEKAFEQGIIKVSLFDSDGELMTNYELKIDMKQLDEIIYARIDKGVRNFFLGLAEAFNLPHDTNKIDCVNILLAGNSCKSLIVKDLFDKYITEYNERLSEVGNGTNHFTVFPPLGTEESREILLEKGIGFSENDLENPTGKTGVAFGLIRGRQGGKIKVITEKANEEEIKFMYYIGNERKRKFKVISNREIPYMAWKYLIDAEEEDFTVYYTTLPECIKGSMDIASVSRKKCSIPIVSKDANVYYRAIGPSSIEYVVARSEEIELNIYLSEIFKLNLGGE